MPTYIFPKKLFIYLFIGVFLSAIFGIILHECGHYAAYRYFGFKYASVSYDHTNWGMANNLFKQRRMLQMQYDEAIQNHRSFDTTELTKLNKIADTENIYISAAGPLVNIIIGTIGLLLLVIYRKRFYNSNRLNGLQWLIILLTLQWMRPIIESVKSTYRYMRHLPFNSDEYKVAKTAGWNFYLLLMIIMALGIAVICSIIKSVPKHERSIFLAATLSGGLCGLFVWLELHGPRLLP